MIRQMFFRMVVVALVLLGHSQAWLTAPPATRLHSALLLHPSQAADLANLANEQMLKNSMMVEVDETLDKQTRSAKFEGTTTPKRNLPVVRWCMDRLNRFNSKRSEKGKANPDPLLP
mmetsp:Transcript_7000/g.9105  ORF Transcript_7000/g.9105 Transcript_7000/m.9105 type:complete len:117 (-) Transcript_7000:310-660(-)